MMGSLVGNLIIIIMGIIFMILGDFWVVMVMGALILITGLLGFIDAGKTGADKAKNVWNIVLGLAIIIVGWYIRDSTTLIVGVLVLLMCFPGFMDMVKGGNIKGIWGILSFLFALILVIAGILGILAGLDIIAFDVTYVVGVLLVLSGLLGIVKILLSKE